MQAQDQKQLLKEKVDNFYNRGGTDPPAGRILVVALISCSILAMRWAGVSGCGCMSRSSNVDMS